MAPAKSPRQPSATWSPVQVHPGGLRTTRARSSDVRTGPIPREEYAARGLIHQQLMLPGTEHVNGPPKLQRWEDMDPAKQAKVSATLKGTYGITMRNAIHNHGALIDRQITDSGESGRNFYRGGDIDHDGPGQDRLRKLSAETGVPTHHLAYMRAALSPRSNVHDEVTNLRTILNHDPSSPEPPTIMGFSAARNARKAWDVRQHTLAGGEPHEAKDAKGKPHFGTTTTMKITRYATGYTHPDHPDTLTAVDTHAVGGMAPHLPKQAPTQPAASGGRDARGRPYMQPVGKGDPRWVPNQEDVIDNRGAYEFFDYAQRQAAEKRGLSATEGQSLAWHAERGARKQQPGAGRGRTGGGSKVPQAAPPLHPGQMSLL